MIADLQRMLDASPFAGPYRYEILAAADGRCSIRVPYSPQFDRPDGIVSGQVVMTAADVAVWLAIKTLRGIDDNSVTTQMETHFFRSARQEPVLCHAEVLNSAKRRTFATARCVTESGVLLTYHTLTYTSR